LQRPIAAELLKGDPPEQQRVGRLSLLAESGVEIGLIDVLGACSLEPALACVDDAVERDVLGYDQLPQSRPPLTVVTAKPLIDPA
jgi:hypothetical protein